MEKFKIFFSYARLNSTQLSVSTYLFTPMLTVPQLEIVDESMLLQVLPDIVDPGLGELGLAAHVVLLQRSQNPQSLNSKVLKHLQTNGKSRLV